MGIDNLDKLFEPRSIAVVGANDRQGSIGNAIMGNLVAGEFAGEIFPVNIEGERVGDRRVSRSVRELEATPELAVICTPIDTVPDIVADCGEKGVAGAVIISAGGRETGVSGRQKEKAIQEAAKTTGIRVIGPNCIGIACAQSKLHASFAGRMPLPGKTAFISQSGSIFTAMLDISIREQIGFSYFVSLGSMLDVDFGDLIDYLGGEPRVNNIVIYAENLSHCRKFMSAVRSVSRVKPIIAMKAGRTPAGSAAAASHTGAMAGEDAIYDAALKRAGIVRVRTFEELFDCSELLAKQPRFKGSGMAVITNAGGPGVLAADALADYELEPVLLSQKTQNRLDEVLPAYWSRSNPVDILGNADAERYGRVVDICLDAPEVQAVLIILSPHALNDPTAIAQSLCGQLENRRQPIFTCWMGGPDVEKGRECFNQAGIPTFDTPERAVRAFMDIRQYSRNIEMLQEIPPKLPGKLEFDRQTVQKRIDASLEAQNPLLTELATKELLAAYGIPVNPTRAAASSEEAVGAARELGFPVVLKIHSPDISHKSEVEGVSLDLRNPREVEAGFDRLTRAAADHNPKADIAGVTVQPMIRPNQYELILGARMDREFGPVILFGTGGIMTEVMRDRAIALPPLNRLLARRLMEETRIYRLLRGYRNYPAADLVKLEEILIRLAQLVIDFPQIAELDINPLIVSKDRILAADARVLLKPARVASPLHLVISPYPNQHESHAQTKDGKNLLIRPIRPEDAPLFESLFESLSAQSVYFRFFSPMRHLSKEMLARFTQIDYDRQVALVAIHQPESGEEQMLGVGRIITERDGKAAEFSILISDAFHGQGIGANLLARCLDLAREQGIEKVWGIVLPENKQMLALGRKLGFAIERDPDSSDYLLKKDFRDKAE